MESFCALLSLGIFLSSLSENQIVTFICTVTFSALAILIGEPGVTQTLKWVPGVESLQPVLLYLGIKSHFDSIARGVLDLRDVFYYVSFAGFFLYLTSLVVEHRRR